MKYSLLSTWNFYLKVFKRRNKWEKNLTKKVCHQKLIKHGFHNSHTTYMSNNLLKWRRAWLPRIKRYVCTHIVRMNIIKDFFIDFHENMIKTFKKALVCAFKLWLLSMYSWSRLESAIFHDTVPCGVVFQWWIAPRVSRPKYVVLVNKTLRGHLKGDVIHQKPIPKAKEGTVSCSRRYKISTYARQLCIVCTDVVIYSLLLFMTVIKLSHKSWHLWY